MVIIHAEQNHIVLSQVVLIVILVKVMALVNLVRIGTLILAVDKIQYLVSMAITVSPLSNIFHILLLANMAVILVDTRVMEHVLVVVSIYIILMYIKVTVTGIGATEVVVSKAALVRMVQKAMYITKMAIELVVNMVMVLVQAVVTHLQADALLVVRKQPIKRVIKPILKKDMEHIPAAPKAMALKPILHALLVNTPMALTHTWLIIVA